MTAPLCRFCARPIRKKTDVHWFGRAPGAGVASDHFRSHTERPRSREEVQRLVNGQVVSVRWSRGKEFLAEKAGFDFIDQASTWDGETYVDPYFCHGGHAREFGYAAAAGGHAMRVWHDAMAARRGEKP